MTTTSISCKIDGLRLLCLLLLFGLMTHPLQAQGWLKHYPATGGILTGAAEPTALVVADNGDFLFGGGGGFVPTLSASFLYVQRNDANGIPVWLRTYALPAWDTYFMEKCPGGGYICGGSGRTAGTSFEMMFKFSEAGDSLWMFQPDPSVPGWINSAIPTPDGNILIGGVRNIGPPGQQLRTPTLYKINANDGSVIWTKSYPGHPYNEGGVALLFAPDSSILESNIGRDTTFIRHLDQDGDLLYTVKIPLSAASYPMLAKAKPDGYTFLIREAENEAWYRRYDYQGNLLQSTVTPNVFFSVPPYAETNEGFGFEFTYVTANGHFLPSITKVDTSGNVFAPIYPMDDFSTGIEYIARGIRNTPDGGYLIVGPNGGQPTWFALKTDSNGHFDYGLVSGNVFKDDNLDCDNAPAERGLRSAFVEASDLNQDVIWYESADSSGNYTLKMPVGNYQVEVITPGSAPGYWAACPPQNATLTLNGDSISIDSMGLKPLVECPFLQLDIGASIFRPCVSSSISVSIQNTGTVMADSAMIHLELDSLLTFASSTLAPVAQNGNQLWFHVDSLDVFESYTFQITAFVNCDVSFGEVLCINGDVTPDSICSPGSLQWDGSDLRVDVQCTGDGLKYKVTNVGTGDMTEVASLIIIEDYIILRSIPLLLPAGVDTVLTEVNPAGTTYYAQIRQSDGYIGHPFASDGVDFCFGPSVPGMLLQYPMFSGGVFGDQYCDETRAAYDPNDKQGFPLGYGGAHYVDRGVPIDYRIRFQNTGNDTAFLVVIRDSLPNTLDVATFRMGASSHPVTWNLSGQGNLTFRFDNILLPDSTTNEAASHGFVQFSILPKTDIAAGTVVENRAGIYFDYNAPVMTDYSLHTVDSNFIPVTVRNPEPVTEINAWPNPATDITHLDIPEFIRLPCTVNLFDTYGKMVRQEKVSDRSYRLKRMGLPAGLYFMEVADLSGHALAKGKIIWGAK